MHHSPSICNKIALFFINQLNALFCIFLCIWFKHPNTCTEQVTVCQGYSARLDTSCEWLVVRCSVNARKKRCFRVKRYFNHRFRVAVSRFFVLSGSGWFSKLWGIFSGSISPQVDAVCNYTMYFCFWVSGCCFCL